MTEFNPFSAGEQAPEYAPEQPDESGGSRRNVLLAGGLAAVVLGAGAFVLLGGGGEEEAFVPVKRAPRVAAAAAAPAPAAKLPVATKVTLGRNPFRALYVAPVAAAGGSSTSGGTTTAGTSGSGATPTTTTAPSSGGGTAPVVIVDSGSGSSSGSTGTPAQPAPAPAAQSTVALKKVVAAKDGANPTATFVYDGKEVTGAPGDVMAGKLLVISLQQDATGGWFANLQLGDGSPFEVHERQTVVVQ